MIQKAITISCIFIFIWVCGCTPTEDEAIAPESIYVKFYGRNGFDQGIGIVRSPDDGGVTVLGSRSVGGQSNNQITLFRMDSAGNLLWDRAFPETSDAVYSPNAMINDPSGGFLIAGERQSGLVSRAFILRVNADGSADTNWGPQGTGFSLYGAAAIDTVDLNNNEINRTGQHGFFDIKEFDGGYALAGTTNNVRFDKAFFDELTDESDAWVLILDNQGQQRFSHRIGFPGIDKGFGIIPINNNELAVMGSTTRSAFDTSNDQLGGENVLFSILDKEGKSISTEIFGSQNGQDLDIGDAPVDFIRDGDGFAILANNLENNAIVFQLTATGKLVSTKNLFVSTTAGDESTAAVSASGASLLRTLNGDYIMVGRVVTQFNAQNNTDRGDDMLVMKLGQSLTVNNDRVYNYGGQEDDIANDVLQFPSGNLMVLGTTNFENGNTMITLMKTNSIGRLK